MMKNAKFVIAALVLLIAAACGTPTRVVIRNVSDLTATPAKVAEVPGSPAAIEATTPAMTAAATAAVVPTTANDMPGMVMPTNPPASTLAPGDGQGTPFVLIDVLNGQSTPTAGAAAPTSQPANNVTQAAPTTASTTAASTNPPPTAATKAAAGTGKGDPAAGKTLFNSQGCAGCHDVSAGIVITGPSLKGIATRAGTRKPGMTAQDYLHESIVNPNAYVVKGFTAGIMVQNFGQILSPTQIDNLVAYLMTLK